MTQLSQFTDGVVESVRGYIARNLGPLVERISALEKREPLQGEKGLDGKEGPEGKPGADGKDGAPGKDGRDGVDGKDGAPGKDGEHGQPGVNGKDADPLIIKALVTEAAATIQPIHGKDGKDGRDGVDGRDGDPGRDAFAIDVLPAIDYTKRYQRGTWAHHAGGLWHARAPTDGMNGWSCIVNGLDAIDISAADDLRTVSVSVKLSNCEVRKDLKFPVTIHRGIWREGADYEKGDQTTRGGSQWTLMDDMQKGKPGDDDSGWQLSSKCGRDGRDGLKGEKGERGSEGRAGKDLTQLGFDGKKY